VSKPPILFIHGSWVTAKYWEHWIPFFEDLGYEVHAAEWPGINGRTPEEVRADPLPLANKHIEEIIGYYEAFIHKLLSPSIIIGHSLGGLLAQTLFNVSTTVSISEQRFHWAFVNNTTSDKSREYYERYCVPGVARVPWQLTTYVAGRQSAPTYVEFDRVDRAPLLLLSASKDHIVPPETVFKNFKAYTGLSLVEYKMFPGRTHGLIFQPGWE
ncbi:arylesterase, partial [Colletotrichum salicis]